MNVTPGTGGWVNWWMSYLNYQIEHHLFPSMPQFRHPQVSPRVKELFKKHNVEYVCVTVAFCLLANGFKVLAIRRRRW
jgi:fatty acid desaturase